MTVEIRYASAAVEDLREACHWLEGVEPGLSARLLDELDNHAKAIVRYPEMYERCSPVCRRVVLRTFDYALVYRISSGTIEVVALLHCRLDPMIAALKLDEVN